MDGREHNNEESMNIKEIDVLSIHLSSDENSNIGGEDADNDGMNNGGVS